MMNIQAQYQFVEPVIFTQGSSQSFAQRVKDDKCYNCNSQGHWARDCPNKTPKKSTPTSSRPNSASESSTPHAIQCRCGAGTCVTRTSKTDKNPGRKFYTCPLIQGCGYFKWCDQVTTDDISYIPMNPFPTCGCGAGICVRKTVESGEDAGRNYFVCPIPKGDGACTFFQWQDDTRGNTTIPVHNFESQIISSNTTIPGHNSEGPIIGSNTAIPGQSFASPITSSPRSTTRNRGNSANPIVQDDTRGNTTIPVHKFESQIISSNTTIPVHKFESQIISSNTTIPGHNSESPIIGSNTAIPGQSFASPITSSPRSTTRNRGNSANPIVQDDTRGNTTIPVHNFESQTISSNTTIPGHNSESPIISSNTAIPGQSFASPITSSPQSTMRNRGNSDLVEEDDVNFKRLKRMEVVENPQTPPISLVLQPERRDSTECYNMLQDDSSEYVNSVSDSITGQLVVPQAKSRCSLKEKATKVSLLSSQAEIHRRQTTFLKDMFAVGATKDPINQIIDSQVLNWLGRLAFPPSRCLTVPSPKPFFCRAFPSFDPISIPRDVPMLNNEDSIVKSHESLVQSEKFKELSLLTPVQDSQLSISVLLRPPSQISPPNMVHGNIITDSILEVFKQAAVQVQNSLLSLLESLDPRDHESMVREANSAFEALERLSVHYTAFHERVKEFIECASSLAGIELSIQNDTLSQERIERRNSTNLRLNDLSRVHAEVAAAFSALDEHLKFHREEVCRLKNMLLQIEKQVSTYETESMSLETHLLNISEEMEECKQNLQVACREAEEAGKLLQEREEARKAAQETFVKAKVRLRQ